MNIKDFKLNEWLHIGDVGVDAGLIMVGDPCYCTGDPPANAWIKDWDEFCKHMLAPTNQIHGNTVCEIPFEGGDEGAGVAVSSGYGDGLYPVYAKFSDEDDWGIRIKELKVVFI